jgi:arginine metabolism regulation protein II
MVIQMRDECCVNASHLDLDQVLRDLQNRVFETDEFTRIGPFGIMPIARTGTCDSNPVHSRGDSGADTVGREHRQSAEEFDEKLLDLNWGQMESFPAWETTIANPEANVEDSFFSHQTPIPSPQNSPEQIFQVDWTQQHLHVSSPDISDLLDLPANTQDILPSSNAGYKPTILTMSNDANLRKIPTEARLLLDYYSCRIIDVMSMSPGTKPPWKTIHLPCAMSALAELMVHGETKSFAKMSLFYALLSVSSYHMGSSGKQSKSVSQYWQERGALHKHNAETFLRAALAKDLPKSSRGKYKEILMSFLSMVTIGVCASLQEEILSDLSPGLQRKYAGCPLLSS